MLNSSHIDLIFFKYFIFFRAGKLVDYPFSFATLAVDFKDKQTKLRERRETSTWRFVQTEMFPLLPATASRLALEQSLTHLPPLTTEQKQWPPAIWELNCYEGS